eukprot:jgi/Botrbrau1/21722/Bobra.43_1s0116.1
MQPLTASCTFVIGQGQPSAQMAFKFVFSAEVNFLCKQAKRLEDPTSTMAPANTLEAGLQGKQLAPCIFTKVAVNAPSATALHMEEGIAWASSSESKLVNVKQVHIYLGARMCLDVSVPP